MRRRSRKSHTIQRLVWELGCLDQRAALRAEGRLIKIGVPAVPLLIRAAASDDAQTRFRAVWALGKIGDPRALLVVVTLTNDPDARVAYDAASALRELKGDRHAAGDVEAVL